MKNNINKLIGLLLATIFTALFSRHTYAQLVNEQLDPLVSQKSHYKRAVVNAALRRLKTVPLLELSTDKNNPSIEMVTWTDEKYAPGWQKVGENIWVVQAHQMRAICEKFSNNIPFNIESLLGMPPLSNYHKWRLVRLQVPNKQASIQKSTSKFGNGLLRPCFSTDSVRAKNCSYEIQDTQKAYATWLSKLSLKQLRDNYPWTGLGYTYNWNPHAQSIIGPSEFIITAGTTVNVLSTQTADNFCND